MCTNQSHVENKIFDLNRHHNIIDDLVNCVNIIDSLMDLDTDRSRWYI